MTFYQWYTDWNKNRPSERLGQAFCNDFIRCSWPDLYYCRDDDRAYQMIYFYLTDMCYYPNMPDIPNKEK